MDEQRRLRLTVTDLETNKRLLRDTVVATLGEGESDETDVAGQDRVTGREPCLSAYARPGQVRLSLRGVASMLNLLPPESISLEAAAAALRSPDCTVRYSAAEMLSKHGDRDARRIMQDVLENGAPPQRASVVRHLHRLSWFGAEPLLRLAFADPDERVHESAIFALCKMHSREAYQLAQEILPGEGDNVRLEAAWTLKDSHDPRAVPIRRRASICCPLRYAAQIPTSGRRPRTWLRTWSTRKASKVSWVHGETAGCRWPTSPR